MSDITKQFQDIMSDIENNINDEKKFAYVNEKITEILMLNMQMLNEMTDIIKNKINNIEKVQSSIETKVNKIQNSLTGIENDIYDEGFDFEIVCPYCNTEFIADVESKSDIKCPECQNVIELDWNGGEDASSCHGHCSSCSSQCGESFFDEFGEDISYTDDDDDDM